MQKIMKDECDSKEGKLSFTGLDTAESNLILCKDDANERKASLLLISRVQLILYKDNANEHNESLLLHCRVQLILYKDIKITLNTPQKCRLFQNGQVF